MSEFELIQLAEAATAQIVQLVGQTIAINFAMIVGIYYFLNRAGLAIKIAAFLLYALGSLMFFFFMLREANIAAATADALEALAAGDGAGTVTTAMLAFGDSPVSLALTVLLNTSYWALWVAVIYLLFVWKREAGEGGD